MSKPVSPEGPSGLHRRLPMPMNELLDATGVAVIVTDPTGSIMFWNATATSLCGRSADEAWGRQVHEVVSSGESAAELAQITEDLRAGGRWEAEQELRRPDGTTVTVLTSRTLILDDEGALVAVITALRDISSMRRALTELASSEGRFRELIRGSGNLFAITDAAGVIGFLDGPVEAYFGVEAKRLIGTSLFDLVQPDDLERATTLWVRRVTTTNPMLAEEFWTRRADGSRLCLSLLVNNLIDSPTLHGIVVTARDVTLSKHLEEARRAVTAANSALVHATTESELSNAVCDLIVGNATYRLAWIGLPDHARSLRVRMVAFAGQSAAYVEGLERIAARSPYRGPLAVALETRVLAVVQEVKMIPSATRWRRLALENGYRSLIALPLSFDGSDYGVLAIYSGEPNAFTASATDLLSELAADLSYGIGALRAREGQSAYRTRFEASLEATVRAIATAAELRDPYTAGHQRRVAELATAIGTELGLDAELVAGIGVAASIHDIGKLAVPAEILSRPGPLTHAEFALVQEHSRAGGDIVAGIDFPWPVAEMIAQHHERLDGSGYPSRLHGKATSIGARVIAVADTIEAMHSHRPYRPGLSIETALKTIATGRGTLFDSKAVDACTRLFREHRFEFTKDGAGSH